MTAAFEEGEMCFQFPEVFDQGFLKVREGKEKCEKCFYGGPPLMDALEPSGGKHSIRLLRNRSDPAEAPRRIRTGSVQEPGI